jgi:hypothetical protein
MLRPSGMLVLLAMGITPFLAGCGTYVPAIQEIGDDHKGEILIQEIVSSIRCEIRNALAQIYWDDVNSSKGTRRRAAFLDDWGAQVQLTLTIKENTQLNPSASWMPDAIFTLGGSLTGSAAATRIDKLNYFYKIAELRSRQGCVPGPAPEESFPGSLLIQSNLKLHSALTGLMLPIVTDDISVIQKQNGFTYEVTFEVISTGTVTPAWKLSRVFSVDQSGTFFSTTRDRTHDLLITLGPIDPNASQTLAPTAQGTFYASQINQAIANGAARGSTP